MLEQRGWDNQGNGSTVAALETRGLLTRSSRPTTIGRMVTVALTRAGRAAALAGTSTASASTARARKAKPLGDENRRITVPGAAPVGGPRHPFAPSTG
jgi:DNA-binding MarR family transcriptional regulator